MLTPLQIRDHVIGIDFFVQIRAQRQTEANWSLRRESDDEIGILRRDRGRWYMGDTEVVRCADVDKAEICTAYRANQHGDRACLLRRYSTVVARHNWLLVGIERKARVRHSPIETLIEENDLARYLVARPGSKFGKTVYGENLSRDAISWRSDARPSKCSDNDSLGCPWYLVGVLDEFAVVFTSYPPWHSDLFETHVKPELSKLISNVVDSRSCLQGTNRARTDVVAEVG